MCGLFFFFFFLGGGGGYNIDIILASSGNFTLIHISHGIIIIDCLSCPSHKSPQRLQRYKDTLISSHTHTHTHTTNIHAILVMVVKKKISMHNTNIFIIVSLAVWAPTMQVR